MAGDRSQHSATSSTRRRQEAELAAAEERRLAAAAAAEAAARASRLAAAELAAARAEAEAVAAAEAARVAAAELEALRSSVNSSVPDDGSIDADLADVARERVELWAAEHALGRGAPGGGTHGGGIPGGGAHGGGAPGGGAHGGGAPGGGAHGGGAPGGGAHCGGAPGGGAHGGGAPGGGAHGGGGGWLDQDRGLYGVRTVVRDVGPGVGWPTLTKTNYVEWAAVMRIRLQVRHMWEAVQGGDVDHHEDRRALDALIAAVPPEMQFSLSNKRTAKEAWDAIAAARIGSDRARKSTLQALRTEWEHLA